MATSNAHIQLKQPIGPSSSMTRISLERPPAGSASNARKSTERYNVAGMLTRPSIEFSTAGPSGAAGVGQHIQLRRGSQEQYRTSLEMARAYNQIKQSVDIKHESIVRAASQGQKPPRAEPKKPGAKSSDYDVEDHKLGLEELARNLGTNLNAKTPADSTGLSAAEAKTRLETNGKNKLTPPPGKPEWLKYMLQYTNKFMLLLMGAGILCFIAYGIDTKQQINMILGVVLWAIVIIMCTISYMQERKAGSIMDTFKNMLPPSCLAIRDGQQTKVAAEDLVVGDVVVIKAGDKVPADIRILQADDLKVDNSSLTGESDPQSRSPDCTDENPMETKNLAFYSTLVLNGQGKGVVIRCGDDTLIGKIANLASGTENVKTTLEIEIEHFVHFIGILAIVMGIIFFIVSVAVQSRNADDKKKIVLSAIINTIGIIVANIPEGLPATVTLCLTIAARKMAIKNVFVKRLECVETLGSTTCIASDKTGTLTQNRMTAAHLMYDHEIFSADTKLSHGAFDRNSPSGGALLRIAANCNRSDYDRGLEGNMEKPISERVVIGDASETALLRLTDALEDIEQQRARAPKKFEIPFNSTNKWQLSVHKVEGQKDMVLMLKGAPERVFDRCSHVMVNGNLKPIDAQEKASFEQSYETLGAMGERVLGFAQLTLPADQFPDFYSFDAERMNFPTEGLTFVGLISLIDPPRESVPGAIEKCKHAGIRVIMVTGDHPITAKAIAKSIGIIWETECGDIMKDRKCDMKTALRDPSCKAVVIKGGDIPSFDDEMWDLVLEKKQVVFARTSPQQKLQIVENLQSRGEIVAVTGDGVNDSPALKKADVGCAMGICGSDVSKEAADIILMDDSFGSIVAGIEEGRTIFDNLKKSIAYTLTHLGPEILPFLVAIAGNVPTLMASILILFIDLMTEMVPASSLAYELPEADIMDRPPRNPQKDRMVSWQVLLYSYIISMIISAAGCFATDMYVLQKQGLTVSSGILSQFDKTMSDALPTYCGDPSTFAANSTAPATGTFVEPYTKRDCGPSFDPTLGKWTSPALTDFYADQVFTAASAHFMCIVHMQLWHVFSVKTRKVSIFQQGFRNMMMNFSLVWGPIIVIAILFIPGLNTALNARPLMDVTYWLIALPFGVTLLAYNEGRRWWGRKWPKGVVDRVLNW